MPISTRGTPWRSPARFTDFDDWIAELWTVRWTAVALAVAAYVAVSFGAQLDVKVREQQAFDNALSCALTTSSSCTIGYQATVQDKGTTGTKDQTYYLDLTGPAPADGRFDLPQGESLWNVASPGDYVTAIEWKGSVVRIVDGAVSGDTDAAPGVKTAMFTALFASSAFWVLAIALFLLRLLQLDFGILKSWSKVIVAVNPVAMAGMFLFPLGAVVGYEFGSPLAVVLSGIGMVGIGALIVTWSRLRDPNRA